MATIVTVPTGGRIRNHSGITLDVANLTSMNGINELPDYREVWEEDNLVCTRTFDVPWSRRKDFVDEMVGFSRNLTDPADPTKGKLTRLVPDQHPEYPWLYAVSAEMFSGVGAYGKNEAGSLIAFYDATTKKEGFARTRVTYRALDYRVASDSAVAESAIGERIRYISRFYTYSAENLKLPGSAFRWVTAPQDSIQEPPPKLFPTKEITLVWHEVPDVPEANIESTIGKVNDASFTDQPNSGRLYEAGTLLFLAPDIKRYRTVTGRVAHRISYKFLFRATGHNKLYRRSTGQFEDVSRDGTTATTAGNRIYDSADFSLLFTQPTPVSSYL